MFAILIRGCNVLENPIGIETAHPTHYLTEKDSCNVLENPIGIETELDIYHALQPAPLQRTRKPDRD